MLTKLKSYVLFIIMFRNDLTVSRAACIVGSCIVPCMTSRPASSLSSGVRCIRGAAIAWLRRPPTTLHNHVSERSTMCVRRCRPVRCPPALLLCATRTPIATNQYSKFVDLHGPWASPQQGGVRVGSSFRDCWVLPQCFIIKPATTEACNARKRPRKTDGRTPWSAPLHILSMYPDHTIPTERPHRYPGYVSTLLQEVQQFNYFGLRLDPMVNMKAAVSSIQEKANNAHSLVLAVSYSLRYDKHHSNPTICSSSVELLNLWKSCVIPHFLLYLRYISDETQVKTVQASLNKSLSTTMHVYGHPTALLSDTGILPLYITKNMQLAQHRFRLYSSPPFTIQHFLWNLWQPLLQAVPVDTLEDRMQNAVGQVDPPRRDPNSPMPHNVTLSKPHNKEKSYKKYLEIQCSDQWRKHLQIVTSNPPGRARAYVHWHLHNKHKRILYKPAPYLTHRSSP